MLRSLTLIAKTSCVRSGKPWEPKWEQVSQCSVSLILVLSTQSYRCKAISEHRYFHLILLIQTPWSHRGRHHSRRYVLQRRFLHKLPFRSRYRLQRIQGEFSKLKLGCTHSFPVCANYQQLKHKHCSHLPWGIPLKLGEGSVMATGASCCLQCWTWWPDALCWVVSVQQTVSCVFPSD